LTLSFSDMIFGSYPRFIKGPSSKTQTYPSRAMPTGQGLALRA
jgi:hypothetical protein